MEIGSGAIDALPEMSALTPVEYARKQRNKIIASVEDKIRSSIAQVAHVEVLDATDGHAITGFFDGSKRSLDPNGLELRLLVVSPTFEGMKTLARHQLVHQALGTEIQCGIIHALPR